MPGDRAPDSDARPPHRQPRLLLLVALGGFVGVWVRYAVTDVLPTRQDGWPTATFTVNLVGSFLLGVLLEALSRGGADTGRRLQARLLAGTGFCGGLTTYSSLAVEADLLVRSGRSGLALAYGVTSALAGLAVAAAGVVVSSRRSGTT